MDLHGPTGDVEQHVALCEPAAQARVRPCRCCSPKETSWSLDSKFRPTKLLICCPHLKVWMRIRWSVNSRAHSLLRAGTPRAWSSQRLLQVDAEQVQGSGFLLPRDALQSPGGHRERRVEDPDSTFCHIWAAVVATAAFFLAILKVRGVFFCENGKSPQWQLFQFSTSSILHFILFGNKIWVWVMSGNLDTCLLLGLTRGSGFGIRFTISRVQIWLPLVRSLSRLNS